ncbi:hypothetical protein L6164_032418 [Bauhinia variegata]|uniref:Uncharacterized protein n=1 Tax=Bauhinia variegata TaxID=167791 RepID=A0ACB9KP08_BAUVA|nr:hypothetical protein L6164_032418 [Bauhinia variegata]
MESLFHLNKNGSFHRKKKNSDTTTPQALQRRKGEQQAPTTRPIKHQRQCRCCCCQRRALITTQTSGLGTTATATGDRLMGEAVEAIVGDREWVVLGDVTQSELSVAVDLELMVVHEIGVVSSSSVKAYYKMLREVQGGLRINGVMPLNFIV